MVEQEKISKWMKRSVVSTRPDTTVKAAAALLAERRVGTLPVVDEEGVLVGVISIGDIIQIFLPDFVSILSDIGFVKDYGSLGTPTPESVEIANGLLVADIMVEPVAVEDDCALIRALSVMEKHNLGDLLVVKDGILVGLASRVDIGRAFLVGWQNSQAEEPETR